jgi:hypothetical protein
LEIESLERFRCQVIKRVQILLYRVELGQKPYSLGIRGILVNFIFGRKIPIQMVKVVYWVPNYKFLVLIGPKDPKKTIKSTKIRNP